MSFYNNMGEPLTKKHSFLWLCSPNNALLVFMVVLTYFMAFLAASLAGNFCPGLGPDPSVYSPEPGTSPQNSVLTGITHIKEAAFGRPPLWFPLYGSLRKFRGGILNSTVDF